MADFKYTRSNTKVTSFEIKREQVGGEVYYLEYEIKVLNPKQGYSSRDDNYVWQTKRINSSEAGYEDVVQALCKVTNLQKILNWAVEEFDGKGLEELTRKGAGVHYVLNGKRERKYKDESVGEKVETIDVNFTVCGSRQNIRVASHSDKFRNAMNQFNEVFVRNDEICLVQVQDGDTNVDFTIRRKPNSRLSFVDVIRKGDFELLGSMIFEANTFCNGNPLKKEVADDLKNAAIGLLDNAADRQVFDILHHFTEVEAASRALSRDR